MSLDKLRTIDDMVSFLDGSQAIAFTVAPCVNLAVA
jgi:hypothetical protein